jgi:hypothetical protein
MTSSLKFAGLAIVLATCFGAASVLQEQTLIGGIISNNVLKSVEGLDDPEDALANLDKGVMLTEDAIKSGYTLLRGTRKIKIDPGSSSLVADYLRREDSTTRVRITGTMSPSGFVIKQITSPNTK